MLNVDIKDVYPLSHQEAFLRATDKVLDYEGSWRAGKTLGLILDALNECERYDKNLIWFGRHEATKLHDSTIRDFHQLLPPTRENWNASRFDYTHHNGSVIMFRHLADKSGLVNMDLGAVYIEQAEETQPDNFDFLMGRLSRLNSSRRMRITDNPNGHDWIWQYFHSPEAVLWGSPHLVDETQTSPMYREGYKLIRCTALDNPHLPPDYVEELRRSLVPEMYEQYILGSREVMLGYRYFDVRAMKQQIIHEPMAVGYFVDDYPKPDWRDQAGGPVRIYERYDERDPYVIGLDVASGEGQSWCAGHIRNCRSNRTAAVIDADMRPDELAVQAWLCQRYYGQAVIAPERNGIGFSVLQALRPLTSNIFNEQSALMTDGTSQTSKMGWTTDAKSRPELFALMQREIAFGNLELKDRELIEQCKAITMHKTRKRPEAEDGFKDDLVLSCGISGMVRKLRPAMSRSSVVTRAGVPVDLQTPIGEKRQVRGYGRGSVKVLGR